MIGSLTQHKQLSIQSQDSILSWAKQHQTSFQSQQCSLQLGCITLTKSKQLFLTTDVAKALYRVIQKIKNDDVPIVFRNLGKFKDWKIVTFSDASHSRGKTFESIYANVTVIQGLNGRCNLIDWQACKPQVPCSSAMASEGDSCLLAVGKIKMVKYLMAEILKVDHVPAKLVTDSNSLKQVVESTNVAKDKRMYVAVATLRAISKYENISVSWVDATRQISDQLTKPSVNPQPLINLMTNGTLDLVGEIKFTTTQLTIDQAAVKSYAVDTINVA